MHRRLITVQRAEWQGEISSPKGGQSRVVPMTGRLADALENHRNLRSRVLSTDDDSSIDWHWAREKMATAQRRAVMRADGKLHKLRHTFGARLAMAGAPAKTIQELMGHQDLQTTMRYLHLTPQHKEAAIRLLERGDILETGPSDTPRGDSGQEKAPEPGRDSGAQLVTRTGLEPMFSA